LEIEGENVGNYTGLGHASGNSVENLKDLENILNQFIPAEYYSEKKLFEDATYSDLKESLTKYYIARNSPIISELFRLENLEVPKDAHSYIKDIFRDLFMQDNKENDFTKTFKNTFIDFVQGHVILGNITDSTSKEGILDNLKKQYAGGNFELLDKVIASSLDKENLAREEVGVLSVHSFDDFKEMMEAIYKNYETKIKQEHIKSQGRNPSTV